ncbi:hypothetical protein MTO96_013109 [Rhipicephalus appendiculatus]
MVATTPYIDVAHRSSILSNNINFCSGAIQRPSFLKATVGETLNPKMIDDQVPEKKENLPPDGTPSVNRRKSGEASREQRTPAGPLAPHRAPRESARSPSDPERDNQPCGLRTEF